MAVKHLVLFQFKADAGPDAVKEATSRMLGLKEGCLNPTSRKQYIRSLTGGKDNSIEGAQRSITHAFVVEFASIEDRNYYVNSDPHHSEFKNFILPFLENFLIVDYSEGVF
ncbi:stress responsive A/B barrel domain protein [Daldinia grandis]|nr:stress responsive A/B barrel domain protein [Daldinia grandis]